MKKIIILLFALTVFIFTLTSCNSEVDTPILDFEAKNVKEISISTLPESDTYTRTINTSEEIAEIINFINDMDLETDFSENPDEYTGMTIVIKFICEDNSYTEVYSFGNMFLKVGNEPWIRMKYDEAEALEKLVLP